MGEGGLGEGEGYNHETVIYLWRPVSDWRQLVRSFALGLASTCLKSGTDSGHFVDDR